jgi:YVTN family beta-propeller protein
MAHFIDTRTFTVIANVFVDTRPREARFTNDAKQAWVSAEIGGTVPVIDAETKQIVKKLGFRIPGIRPELIQPMGIRFTNDGKTSFVALGPANGIAVVDVARIEVRKYILVGQRPWHMSLHPDGKTLYVANGLTNDLTVIDVAAEKAVRSVPAGGALPWGVTVKP